MIRLDDPPHDRDVPPLDFLAGGDALVVGASGGLGAAFVRRLLEQPDLRRVFAWSRSKAAPEALSGDSRIIWRTGVDLERQETIRETAAELSSADGNLRLVVNAAGLLHDASAGLEPERRLDQIEAAALSRSFAVNAIGPMLVLREVLGHVPRRQRSLLISISARVGSIGDNRLGGWYGYRASKAALNQLHRSLSVELGRSRPEAVVLVLHPGTVDTSLSEPFQRNVKPQKLFDADAVAARLLRLADSADADDSGGFFAWNGESVPW